MEFVVEASATTNVIAKVKDIFTQIQGHHLHRYDRRQSKYVFDRDDDKVALKKAQEAQTIATARTILLLLLLTSTSSGAHDVNDENEIVEQGSNDDYSETEEERNEDEDDGDDTEDDDEVEDDDETDTSSAAGCVCLICPMRLHPAIQWRIYPAVTVVRLGIRDNVKAEIWLQHKRHISWYYGGDYEN